MGDLLRQAEDLLGVVEPADRLKAERNERTRANPGERARKQHRAEKPLGQVLDPRGEVDRRPDHCEVEPAWRAHIAKDCCFVDFLRAELDRVGPAQADLCRDFFRRAVALECSFFEAAYTDRT